jgi:hypothetical protein
MTRTAPGEYDTADRFHIEPDLQPSLAEAIEAVPVATFEMPEYPSNGGADAWSRAFEEHLAQFERIRTAIAPWQDRWHLTDEWIAGEVYLALVLVRRPLPATARVGASWTYFDREPGGPFSPIYPPTGGVPGTTAFLHSLAKPLAPLFVFSARWYPQYESRAEISRWLRKQFEQDLTAYLDACETTMEAAGLVRAPKKYPRLRGDARQHLDWLVRFQVQEWSQTRIAQHYERGNAKTVADALRKTATLIGLTRRSL